MIRIEIDDETMGEIISFLLEVFAPLKNQHDRVAQIVAVLKERGPLRLHQICELFGLSKNTVKDHLAKAIERGYITRSGWYYRAITPGESLADLPKPTIRALSKEERARELLEFLKANALTVKQLAEKAGISEPTVQHYLSELVAAKLVSRYREGRAYVYWANEKLEQARDIDMLSINKLRILMAYYPPVKTFLLKGVPKPFLLSYRLELKKKGYLRSWGRGQKYELTEKGVQYYHELFDSYVESFRDQYESLRKMLNYSCKSFEELVEESKLPESVVLHFLYRSGIPIESLGRKRKYYRLMGSEALPPLDCDVSEFTVRARMILATRNHVLKEEFEQFILKYYGERTRSVPSMALVLKKLRRIGIILAGDSYCYEKDCPHDFVRAKLREAGAVCKWCLAPKTPRLALRESRAVPHEPPEVIV